MDTLSIFFYSLIIPSTALLAYQLYRIYLIRKHDRVLYRFCQLRREIISYLRDDEPQLTKKEKESILEILGIVSHSIHNFPALKKTTFKMKIKAVTNIAFYTKDKLEEVEQYITEPENKRIEEIKLKFILSMLYAAYSYTPLFLVKLSLIVSGIILASSINLMNSFIEPAIKKLSRPFSSIMKSFSYLIQFIVDKLRSPVSNLKWLEEQIENIPQYESQLENKHHAMFA